MRFSASLITALLLATPALAQNAMPMLPASSGPAVVGVIQSFDGKLLSLKGDDGKMLKAPLYPNARITYSVPKTLADIKPGDFIASGGTRGPDGKIHANEIRIVAPGGEGQYPMTAPGQVMTNATVKQVMTDATVKQVSGASGTPIIKLTFHGAGAPGAANCTGHAADAPGGPGKGCIGETQFDVPANVKVVAIMPADASILKAGAKASVSLTKMPDGSDAAVRITVIR
jgi:hypothetical protein